VADVSRQSRIWSGCVIPSAAASLMAAVTYLMLAPIFASAREKASEACLGSLRQVASALSMYAQSNDGRYPPDGVDWRLAVTPFRWSEAGPVSDWQWTCTATASGPRYELNPALRGAPVGTLKLSVAVRTVAVYETYDGTRPAYEHMGQTAYAFVDGHADLFAPNTDGGLLWDPFAAIAGQGLSQQRSEPQQQDQGRLGGPEQRAPDDLGAR